MVPAGGCGTRSAGDWRSTDPGAGWAVGRDQPGHEATIDRYGVVPALGLWLRLIDDEVPVTPALEGLKVTIAQED